jgi:hypothetical protein
MAKRCITKAECDQCNRYLALKIESTTKEIKIAVMASSGTISILLAVLGLLLRFKII